ncbi:aldo/keto reductase [Streptomyces sp. NPDC058964]|uniref:aldo/keto reductase n=1 Tax=Streptomyces sp. NPDC058964 TaxID=3346681 RepID=UPI00368A62E2
MTDRPLTAPAAHVPLGGSGLWVHPFALGGNVFGWTADEKQSFAVLDAYAEAGGNFLDTADVYSAWAPGNTGGESERIIGRWLAARGARDRTVLATKAGWDSGLSARAIRECVEASLRRLGTDRIDLFYTHRDDPSVPVEEIVTSLDALVRAGKVRYLAASNIGPERLAASLAYSEREGLARYVALQPHYNLMERAEYEQRLAPEIARHALAVVPYYGLASGFLSGKYRPDRLTPDGPRADAARAYLALPRGRRVLAALDRIAGERGVEAATVALSWLSARPHVVAPLASARRAAQLPALMACAGLALETEELALLDEASSPAANAEEAHCASSVRRGGAASRTP